VLRKNQISQLSSVDREPFTVTVTVTVTVESGAALCSG
jgi:hypothetical protein